MNFDQWLLGSRNATNLATRFKEPNGNRPKPDHQAEVLYMFDETRNRRSNAVVYGHGPAFLNVRHRLAASTNG